jgi:hypothetical protein
VLLLSKHFTQIRWDSSVTQHKTAIMRAAEERISQKASVEIKMQR